MKIVCDKCQTKYSIADDKVSGKVFKIRCKKCSHIIVVKGGEPSTQPRATLPPSAAPAEAVPATDADKVWFLVVGGEQVGPYSRPEVRGRHASGEIDSETYAWREGFGDWLKLAGIDDFRDLAAPGGAAAATIEPLRTDVAQAFAPQSTPAEAAPAPVHDIFSVAAAAMPAMAPAPADDLFGAVSTAATTPAPLAAFAAAAGADREPVRARVSAMASGPTAAGSEISAHDSKLTGQRNENSVLFSLSNLSAMATAGGTAKGNAAVDARGGLAPARTEGSGLIDIRAMAAATLASSAPASDSAVDIPSFSAAPVFSPMVSAPVMMPAPPSGMPRWAVALILLFVAGIAGIGGLVTVMLRRSAVPPPVVTLPLPSLPVVATPVATAVAPATPPAAGQPNPATVAEGKPGETKPAASEVKPGEAKPAVAAADTGARRGKKAAPEPRRGGRGSAALAGALDPAPSAAPAPSRSAKKRGAGGDTLDDLLNEAAPRRAVAPRAAPVEAPPPADDPSLPEQLDRGDVVAGMRPVQAKVQACYGQYHVPGNALVNLTIAKTGRVSAANVGGALEGTPTGDCVARAVRGASFRRFKGSSMSIQYPFRLP